MEGHEASCSIAVFAAVSRKRPEPMQLPVRRFHSRRFAQISAGATCAQLT